MCAQYAPKKYDSYEKKYDSKYEDKYYKVRVTILK